MALAGIWGPRLAWLAIAALGAWSIHDALDGRSSALRWVVVACAWAVWGVGLVALAVPSVFGLTVTRMAAALAVAASGTSWAGGAGLGPGLAFVLCAVVFATLVADARFGQQCVQASAYGDERRFVLRPPLAFVAPVALTTAVWVAAVIAAPLLLGERQWLLGGSVALIAIALTWLTLTRLHVLSRRWLVIVPAGLVVHDHVVLAETLMVPRRDVVQVDLALAGTEAADLTGPASGHAVEIVLRTMATATLAPTKAAPRGTALHVRSFLVAPSRPGAFLSTQQASAPPST
jgi:hypothetical protein